MISPRRYDDALAVLTPVEEAFPRSIRPKQLKGLASRRKGDWKAAQNVLSKLTAAGEMDPETMGIYAEVLVPWFLLGAGTTCAF